MPTTLPDPHNAIDNLVNQVQQQFGDQGHAIPDIVGIHTGGVWVARQLATGLNLDQHRVGAIDVGFHRDDFAHRGLRKTPLPTHMPKDISQQPLLLVDDVLHTGRTIRAAINALFEFGRPSRIWLAVLADRGGRQLPISADFVGATVRLGPSQMLRLSGPEPLTLTLGESGS